MLLETPCLLALLVSLFIILTHSLCSLLLLYLSLHIFMPTNRVCKRSSFNSLTFIDYVNLRCSWKPSQFANLTRLASCSYPVPVSCYLHSAGHWRCSAICLWHRTQISGWRRQSRPGHCSSSKPLQCKKKKETRYNESSTCNTNQQWLLVPLH